MAENPVVINGDGRVSSDVKTGGRSALLPLLVAGALLLAVLVSFWYMWKVNQSAYADEYVRMERLEKRKEELNSLLALPPCEAQSRLHPALSPKPAPEQGSNAEVGPGAHGANVSESVAAPRAGANTPERIENACVFIVSPGGKHQISTGSGFFVAPGYVATNRHVVENSGGKVFLTSKGLGRPVKGQVVAMSQGKNTDFAIIKTTVPPGAQVTALPFAQKPRKTEKVGAWGYPDLVGKNDPAYARLLRGEDFGATPEVSYTEGVISAILPRQPEIIVHTAPISPGNSGGPLLNSRGEVVGINTMITLDESSFRQASLALSAVDLLRFLASNGIAK